VSCYLDEMVEKKAANSGVSPVWMSKNERDVCLVVRYVGHHERKSNDQFSVTHRHVRMNFNLEKILHSLFSGVTDGRPTRFLLLC